MKSIIKDSSVSVSVMPTDSPLLSVVVPVYNVHQWLRHCLQSLTEQGLESYEVILVNDSSRDNSQGICSEWCESHPEFHLINHERNQGLSAARNTGIKEARGEYITFVDSDDFLAPLTLSTLLSEMGDADVIEYPIEVYHLSRESRRWLSESEGTENFAHWMQNRGQDHCYACNKIFRRSLWQGVEFPVGHFFEDIYTIPYVMRKAQSIRSTHKGLYYYCCRTGSISRTYTERNLTDLANSLSNLLQLPENKENDELCLRIRNAQRSLTKLYGKKFAASEQVKIRMRLLFAPGLSWRDRLKVIFYKFWN